MCALVLCNSASHLCQPRPGSLEEVWQARSLSQGWWEGNDAQLLEIWMQPDLQHTKGLRQLTSKVLLLLTARLCSPGSPRYPAGQ